MMRILKRVLPVLLISWVAAGCQLTKITNLTPAQMERNSSGVYPIEAAWETREHTFRPGTLRPQVLVGTQSYPMRAVPVVKDRFEASIPVPPNENTVRYRFKFDYDYNAIPVPRANSKMSPEYKLEIVEKR